MIDWDDAAKATLKGLWAEGLSASQIAHTMSRNGVIVTRNAVIAKVHRLRANGEIPAERQKGERARQTHVARRLKVKRTAATPVEKRPKQPDIPIEPYTPPAGGYEPPAEQLLTLEQLEMGHCRWPIGNPREAEFRFCGGKQVIGQPYCEHHCHRAYQRVSKVSPGQAARVDARAWPVVVPQETEDA